MLERIFLFFMENPKTPVGVLNVKIARFWLPHYIMRCDLRIGWNLIIKIRQETVYWDQPPGGPCSHTASLRPVFEISISYTFGLRRYVFARLEVKLCQHISHMVG